MPKNGSGNTNSLRAAGLAVLLLLGSCHSYRLATQALPATERLPTNSRRAYSLFWGLLNNPQVIRTPVCDSMGSSGVAEVRLKSTFGDALLTFVTLGIYSPVHIEWNCGRPCRQTGEL